MQKPHDADDAGDGTAGAPPIHVGDGTAGAPSVEALADAVARDREETRAIAREARRLDQLAPKYERQEIGSVGFDDFLETIGGDPQGGTSSTGILIPSLASDPVSGDRCRYLIMGARVDLSPGDYVVGWRCMLRIASIIGTGIGEGPTAPFYRMARQIVTPGWRLQDAPYSFHLTYEPHRPQRMQQGPFDQQSFVFQDAGGPSMLYQRAHFPAFPARPGYLGLDQYAPPAMLGQQFHVTRDIRDPWTKGAFEYMRFPIKIPTTIRAYVSVFQSNPATRPATVVANTALAAAGLPPEESFLQVFNSKSLPGGVQYDMAAISLLIDRRIEA